MDESGAEGGDDWPADVADVADVADGSMADNGVKL